MINFKRVVALWWMWVWSSPTLAYLFAMRAENCAIVGKLHRIGGLVISNRKINLSLCMPSCNYGIIRISLAENISKTEPWDNCSNAGHFSEIVVVFWDGAIGPWHKTTYCGMHRMKSMTSTCVKRRCCLRQNEIKFGWLVACLK